jgi:hypothetical protein
MQVPQKLEDGRMSSSAIPASSAGAAEPRPRTLKPNPIRIDRVFDDPDAVLAHIRQRAPFLTTPAYHDLAHMAGPEQDITPWFRDHLDDNMFFHNPAFLAATREAFSAEIIRPTRCQVNLYGPMVAGAAHLDAAAYRGMSVRQSPIWLMYNMAASGLFEPWMVPVASGLAWFYRGEGGAFEYWPAGEHACVEPPLWNNGLICDNEYTWHRVGAVGTAQQQQHLQGRLRVSDQIHAGADGTWDIRDGERLVARLAPEEVRVSILWKADVFRDEEHLASFENPALDLDIDRVVDIYLDDLSARGIRAERPTDPLNDDAWRELLQDTYRPPIS